jgi:ParB-like chromosome segregation protein Spo0J
MTEPTDQKPPETGLAVELWPLDRLPPYENNARTHSPEQVAQLAASILEFGFTNPILADEKGVIAGHGRLLALQQLWNAGETVRLPNGTVIPPGMAPTIDCSGWSPSQRRAYALADNQLALNAGWDTELLQMEVAALNLADFDLGLLGFDSERIAGLLDPEGIDGEGAPPTGADGPGKDYQQKYVVAVECSSEAEQETVYERLNGQGYACRLLRV